jgi:hypothetical protein
MDDSTTLILIVVAGVLILAAAAMYFKHVVEKRRTDELQQVATQLGLEFLPKEDGTLLADLEGFRLFSRGHSKRIFNLMRGTTRGSPVAIFDYQYTTGHGRHRHTATQSVICLFLESAHLPTFCLRPEGVWHKVGGWLGYQDIDFEDYPLFSKNYLLRGDDEESIRNLFTYSVVAFYERETRLSTEGSGNKLLFYRHAVRVKPDEISPFLEKGLEVLALLHRPARWSNWR